MAKQTKNGKAFEYACLDSINNRYINKVTIVNYEDSAYNTAKNHFNDLKDNHKKILIDGSNTGIEIIEKLEGNLMNFTSTDKLFLRIQTDSEGQKGDVRDVLINKNKKWEIGISAKHNHEAVKHSRLSPKIDFGKKWLTYKCSENYFKEITPIFNILNENKGIKWNESTINKSKDIYIPLLTAFKKELMSLYDIHGDDIPKKLIKYLLGEQDFYKLILDIKKEVLKVNAYNISGTLNKNTNTHKSNYKIKKIHLPTKIFHFDFLENAGPNNSKNKSDTTLELICNNGWQVSFRIHNASSKIENSLKFDVQLIGVPVNIPTFIGII